MNFDDFSKENVEYIVNNLRIGSTDDDIENYINYVTKYYNINKNIEPFETTIGVEKIKSIFSKIQFGDKINEPHKSKELFKKLVENKIFVKLFNPLLQKKIDLNEFQLLIEKIYRSTGIYL